MIYSREAYDIDIKHLMSEIENKIIHKELKEKLQITGDEYLERIKLAFNQTIATKGFSNEPYFIIKEEDSSFEHWLSFYLSLKPKHLISLILDFHHDTSKDTKLFLQKIEHKILQYMDSLVFIPNESQAYEISTWLRTKNQETSSHDIDEDSNGNTKLFNHPFNIKLKEGLAPFCEEESKANLEEIFTTNSEISTPIVLKRSFKIISLLRPMKRLIGTGNANFTQKDAAEWISSNFVLRSGETIKQISVESSVKRFGEKKTLIEPKKAQIKYETWFKKN